MASPSVNPSYVFITQPDNNLVCSICLEVAKEPKQHEDCGKLFCSECIKKNRNKPCPNCRAVNPKYFKDKRGEREIKELGVRCASKKRGCPWIGTIGTLNTHLATCGFTLVPCPNKCGDDEDAGEIQIVRRNLDDHLKTNCPKRLFECPHCKKKGTYASITRDHDKICDKKTVVCPNKESGCLLSMERGKTKQHVSVCEYTEVACAYESLGCGVRMLRKDIKKHETEDNTSHLHLVLGVVKSREEQHKALSEGEALVFKVPGYASKKEKNEVFYSTPFHTHPGGYKLCIRVDTNGEGDGAGTHVSVFTKVLESGYDDQLHWPFLGTVTYELLNQLADDRHHKKTSTFIVTYDMQVGSSRGYPKFHPHSSLCHDPATNTQYLLDNTLYFRVSVKVDNHKPWLVCTDKINMESIKIIENKKTLKNGQQFTFKVTKYSAWKATDDMYTSESFYTSPGGYNMHINAWPNGHSPGKGTHVSVYATLLEGSYDASLSWPFIGTVTLTLLNQLSDENHYSMTVEFEPTDNKRVGDSLGYPKFISHTALSHDPVKNTQYLKNDALYFRVSVEDYTHKPWLTCTHNNPIQ